jgi:tetratricopeptide (TPR) repeat protein
VAVGATIAIGRTLDSMDSPVDLLLAEAMRALQARQPAAAIAPLREAAARRPADARIAHDLGLALLETGACADAVAALRQAVAADPGDANAFFRLGIALEQSGDAAAAVAAYDRATTLRPALPEAWFRAGALVHAMGRREAAIGCFRRAAETGGKTRFGRLGAARALVTEARDAEAERVLRKAVAVDPGNALAHDLLGNLLAEAGRFEEAHACFLRAVALAPLLAGSYYDLVRCRPVTAADRALLAQMEAALATPGLEAGQRQRVHLALGKAMDDLDDPEGAMRHFDAADALRPGSAAFDATAFDEEVGRIIARCTPAALAGAAGLDAAGAAGAADAADAAPILIIGMPRSGTTLVEQILSSHPAVRPGGELNFWNERGAAWHRTAPADTDAAFLRRAATDYLRVLRGIGRAPARVTDKMPFNFLWAGLVHLALPRAVFVHCRRSAIDTALSIHQTLFHPDLAFPTGGAALVGYLRSHARLAAHWRAVLPPGRYIEVEYERLVRDPEPEIRRIVAGCGLPWNDACLRPHLNPHAVRTPSKWQTRQPINAGSVQRWRRYEPFLGALGELLAEESPKGADIQG